MQWYADALDKRTEGQRGPVGIQLNSGLDREIN
jgi:hypothetical protein